jgi:hypothetical protein
MPKLQWSNPLLWVSLVLLLAYGLFTWHLTGQVGRPDNEWTRLAWAYEGAQSLILPAAGALFGTVVQVQQTRDARSAAKEARAKADENAHDAAVVPAVREMVAASRERAMAKARRAGDNRELGAERVSGATPLPSNAEDEVAEWDALLNTIDRLLRK